MVMEGLLRIWEVMEVMLLTPIDSIILHNSKHYTPMGGFHMEASHWLPYAMCQHVNFPLKCTVRKITCQLDIPCHMYGCTIMWPCVTLAMVTCFNLLTSSCVMLTSSFDFDLQLFSSFVLNFDCSYLLCMNFVRG